METIFKPSFKDYCKSFYKENYKKLLRPLEVHKDIVNAVSVNEFENYQYLKNINGQNQFL